MALTAEQAAARVHEAMDSLAGDLSLAADGPDRPIGDYTYPLESTLRDCGLSGISEATSYAQERAILAGMELYTYRRLFRKYLARVSSQQGAGASGMHLQVDWSSTAKTMRMHVREAEETYAGALSAIGRSMSEDPDARISAGQAVVLDSSTDEGAHIIDFSDGLPWLREADYGVV